MSEKAVSVSVVNCVQFVFGGVLIVVIMGR